MSIVVPDYRMIDHTADLGIELRSIDLIGLFEGAALVLFDLLTDLDRVEPAEERTIAVRGVDVADLMVSWLGELLSLHDAEEFLFRRFRVEALSETALEAVVAGERFDPGRHVIKGELKAVTHHGARVGPEAGGWTARIIFDV